MSQNYDFLRSFTIGGKDTKHLFQIAKLNIPFLSKENEFFQVGNTDGKKFRNTRLGDYTLSIDGFIIKDNTGKTVPQVMDELKALVNSDEPQKLVFDIFPDRYFNAIFTGAEEYDATDLKYTPLTLTFDVPDGLAHAIEPIGFSNTYSDNKNLMFDSEYNAINKYMKPWVQKLDEKFDNSNIVWADFTNGIPLNFERDKNSDERWLNWNPMTTIHVPELKVGDEVNFSVYANVVSIDEENNKDYAGQVILEEWDTVKGAILKRHIAYIPKKVTTEFAEYGSVVKIENENTNAINLQYGFRGSNLIKWSKPMVSFLPPIGETVTAPSVGAKAYSNSLDFGDYDYSTAPNLMPTLSYNDISTSWTQEQSAPIPPSTEQVIDNGDYFTVDLSKVTGNFGLYFNNLPRPQVGKEYTWSIEVMSDEPLANNMFFIRPVYINAGGALSAYASPINIGATTNMVRYSRKYTNITDVISNSNCQSLQLYFTKELPRTKVYIRYNMMIQEGDQTSSQAPANQLSKITTNKWYAISAVERTEEEGNITSFKYPANTGINKFSYLQNDRNLIPLLSDKKQYTLSAEVWLEKEVNAPLVYRVNDRNGTGKTIMVANTVNVPAKQWTKVSTTQTINLPSNPNIANPDVSFPINSNEYLVYKANMKEAFVIGQTYTITLKGTKPAGQTFMVYNDGQGTTNYGNLKPVEGLSDTWSLTFTPNYVSSNVPKELRIFQFPQETVGACKIDWLKIEKGNTYTPDYPDHWVQLNAPESYEGIIKIKNDSIKIQEGATTTKPAWKPNLLGAPYYLSKVALGENIASTEATFPIVSSSETLYGRRAMEDFIVGQTYVVTMKATKPATQSIVCYLSEKQVGTFTPVEGLTDVWTTTIKINQLGNSKRAAYIIQTPRPTLGTCQIDWLKIEKGDTRTPSIPYYKYEGIAPAPANNPNEYHWGYSPSYINAVEYVPSGDSVGDLIKIENNGTYRTKPRFSFRMKGENGLVALLNQNGAVLQFGNPEDVDGKQSARVEKGLNEGFWGNTLNPALKVNTGFKSIYPNKNSNPSTPNLVQGTWDMKQDVDAVTPTFKGVGDIQVWHGPTIMADIQAPSNTDRTLPISTHFRFIFDNYDKAQRGRIEFSTFDENGDPIMTAVIRDSNLTSNELVFEAWYKNKRLHEKILDRKVFNKAFYEMNMDRRGDKLIWRLVQIKSLNMNSNGWSQAAIDKEYKFTWTLPEPDTSKFTKTGFWIMRYSNKYHVIMRMTDMQARWEGTPYYQNIENYFQDGDLVEIDTSTRELFVNGVVNNQLNVVGNQWEKFELETGETIIQPLVSEWANMAEVTAEITQNYL